MKVCVTPLKEHFRLWMHSISKKEEMNANCQCWTMADYCNNYYCTSGSQSTLFDILKRQIRTENAILMQQSIPNLKDYKKIAVQDVNDFKSN